MKMNRVGPLVLALILAGVGAWGATDPVLFYDDFEDVHRTQQNWGTAGYTFADGYQGQGIFMETSTPGSTNVIAASLSAAEMAGCIVLVSAMVQAEDVSSRPNPWNGVKVMLVIRTADGGMIYPQISLDTGSWDWDSRGAPVAIPATATQVTLYLGLEAVSGRVWFDNIRIAVLRSPDDYPPARDSEIPLHKQHVFPALRGAMVGTNVNEADLRTLGFEWRANLVRWQLGGCDYAEALLRPDFDVLLAEELAKLDAALPYCHANELMVVIDMHSLSSGLFQGISAQQTLIQAWQQIATRYRDHPAVWAYDLVNEPWELSGNWEEGMDVLWDELAETVAREVRLIDPVKPIIVESGFGGGPSGFEFLKPVDFVIPNIIYSVHMYIPHSFTHQGVFDLNDEYTYPGFIDGEIWNKERLREALSPVKEFQDKYRVPIFVGEFSAIRWAPENSAFYYLQDVISLFEEYDWDWTYHAFREWNGWSVEHSEDPNDPDPTPVPNDRQNLLRSYFSQNVRPFLTMLARVLTGDPVPGYEPVDVDNDGVITVVDLVMQRCLLERRR